MKNQSLGPIIQGMTANASGGPSSACGTPLERVSHGLYALLDDDRQVGPIDDSSGSAEPSRDRSQGDHSESQAATGWRIGLVGCVKQKLARPAPASDLYISTLFKGRRAWVESTCDEWFVLSALHGLVDPDDVLEPYDVTLKNAGRAERRAWSRQVLADINERLGSIDGKSFELHAGADYLEFGVTHGLRARGAIVERPMKGLRFGEQLAAYRDVLEHPRHDATDTPQTPAPTGQGSTATDEIDLDSEQDAPHSSPVKQDRRRVLDQFYALLGQLSGVLGGPRHLSEATGRSGWPDAGVYFFFEPGEIRKGGAEQRVVRVGTHAVSATSNTKLWTRLRAHRGAQHGGGNHRASVFRLHVGTALLAGGGHPEAAATWGQGSSAPRVVRDVEVGLERAVSEHIGSMPCLWLRVDHRDDRRRIEQGAIALLSNHDREAIDPASSGWLGHDADRPLIRTSHLWNVQHTTDPWSIEWLDDFERYVQGT